MKKRDGLQVRRVAQNHEEARFKEIWEKFNEHDRTLLGYLLTPPERSQQYPLEPSDRDWLVANTVVQWLGTHVGQGFLRQAGYIRTEDALFAVRGNAKAAEAITNLAKP